MHLTELENQPTIRQFSGRIPSNCLTSIHARNARGKLVSMVEEITLNTEEFVKNMICVTPTMNKSSSWLCSSVLIVYGVYLVVIYNTPSVFMSLPQSPVLCYLDLVLSSMYFTLLLLFFFLRFFAKNPAQVTTSKFGMTVCLILSVCHLLQFFGLDKHSDHGYHFSLIRKGEWIVCIPLALCLFGHLCKIGESHVLGGCALWFIGMCCIEFGMLASSLAMNFFFTCIGFAIYFPAFFVLYVVCTRLNHLIQASRLLELKIIAVVEVCAYMSYVTFTFILCTKVLPNTVVNTLIKLFDFFPVMALLALVFCFHFGADGSDAQMKLVTLQKTNAAQKLFLRFIFHEVRVPFHSLLLGLEYLATQTGFEQHKHLLGSLLQSAEVMQRTINDVLLLSRLEDGKLELHPAPFSIAEVANSTLYSLQHMSKEKNVQLVAKIDPRLPSFLYGDQHRIGQVLANLVSNALKFSCNDSKVEVVIKELDKNKSSCYFQIQVRDEGIRMTEQEQKVLFLPYSQIRSHETQQNRGSGLGLSIAKHIVELYCGSINVESEQGKGSTFSIYLTLPIGTAPPRSDSETNGPLNDRFLTSTEKKSFGEVQTFKPSGDIVQSFDSSNSFDAGSDHVVQNHDRVDTASAQNPNRTASKSSKILVVPSAYKVVPVEQKFPSKGETKNTPPSSSFSAMPTNLKTALVVDDSQLNRKITRLVLESQGFVVEEAVNGQQAVTMAASKIYSIIFMDNQMPVMSGIEATRNITARNTTPVIGLTGNSLEDDVKEFIDAGARDVLVKPCKREVMLQAISKHL